MTYKVQIDTSKIDIPFTTSTGYTITIEEGFVREESGNRLKNPEISFANTVTTFDNKPVLSPYFPAYNSFTRDPIIRISTNRGAISNTTSSNNFYIVKENSVITTLTNTSSNISYVNGIINIDMTNLLTTNTNYYITVDDSTVRDLFNFKNSAIADDSVIKFITSSSYISSMPTNYYDFDDLRILDRNGLQTTINDDYFAISSIKRNYGTFLESYDSPLDTVTIFSNSGTEITTIESPTDYFYLFGYDLSIDTKLVVAATNYQNYNSITNSTNNNNTYSGKIFVYDIDTLNVDKVINISRTDPAIGANRNRNGAFKVIHKGNYILSACRENVILYNLNGDELYNGVEDGDLDPVADMDLFYTDLGNTNSEPLCMNSTLFGFLHYVNGLRLRLYNLSNQSFYSEILIGSNGYGLETVSIDDTYALIGNQTDREAFVFSISDGSLLYRLTSPDASNNFGSCVSITPNYFIVSDSNAGFESGNPHGRIYLYSRETGELVKGIDNPYTNDPAYLGISLDFGVEVSANTSTLITINPFITPVNDPTGPSFNGQGFRYDL